MERKRDQEKERGGKGLPDQRKVVGSISLPLIPVMDEFSKSGRNLNLYIHNFNLLSLKTKSEALFLMHESTLEN